MKFLLFTGCFIISTFHLLLAQDEFEKANGIGVVTVNLELPVSLEFYEVPTAPKPFRSIILFEDPDVLLNDADRDWLRPHRAFPNEFSFLCLALRDNYYKVITDEKAGTTYWLRNKTFLHFLPLQDYLQQIFPVWRLDTENNPLLTGPYEGANQIAVVGRDCFRIIKISGNWTQVEVFSTDDCSLKGKAIATGWIKWRDERNLLVGH